MPDSDAIVLHHVIEAIRVRSGGHHLSLTVPDGSIYGFIGPNGSGKTTTLRMIMNILLPDEGDDRGARLARHRARRATASAICPKNAASTRR